MCTPFKLLAGFLADLGLKSLFTQVVPQSDLGSALAVLDVMSSAVGVVAPALGGMVLQWGGVS